MPAWSAAFWIVSNGAPAWAVTVPATGSTSSIARIRSRESTTAGPSGRAPPAKPVLPPCGTTLMSCALQNFSTSETCWVVRGRATPRISAPSGALVVKSCSSGA